MLKEIENIELKYLTLNDYQELKTAMIEAYSTMPNSYWKEAHLKSLLEKFPQGQVVIKVNGIIAGCALSIIIDHDDFDGHHTYKEITGNYSFNTHNEKGDTLYGIDVFIKSEYLFSKHHLKMKQYQVFAFTMMNFQ